MGRLACRSGRGNQPAAARWRAALWGLGIVWGLTGCASPHPPDGAPPEGLAYHWQAVQGHWRLWRAARPIDDWLADSATPPATRQALADVQAMRHFASEHLALPDNASYTRYADLQRPAAVWNVVAAPPDALQLKTWCFPVLGCVGYRGYFNPAHAQAQARLLQQQGWETVVYPVPAYSTLGWTNWLGGDPVLNTMLAYPSGERARLLFHELAHQRVYAPDDTVFNESYATAVERLGGARWLAEARERGDEHSTVEFQRFDARRQAFRTLTRQTREDLMTIYHQNQNPEAQRAPELEVVSHPPSAALQQQKAEVLARFRARYAQLRAEWGGYAGYDAWVAQANNAAFAVQAAYDHWVPAFEALFAQLGGDFSRFHAEAARLAALPRAEREAALRSVMPP